MLAAKGFVAAVVIVQQARTQRVLEEESYTKCG